MRTEPGGPRAPRGTEPGGPRAPARGPSRAGRGRRARERAGRHSDAGVQRPSLPGTGRCRRYAGVVGRDADRQNVPALMRRDVRLLGDLLGEVLRESGGQDLLDDVEQLRRAVIDARLAGAAVPAGAAGPGAAGRRGRRRSR